jgi:hypothetical protein
MMGIIREMGSKYLHFRAFLCSCRWENRSVRSSTARLGCALALWCYKSGSHRGGPHIDLRPRLQKEQRLFDQRRIVSPESSEGTLLVNVTRSTRVSAGS